MKRLVFCFDGTWNRLSADTPTNVVLLAASIQRISPKGVTQIMHYDEGVGTGRLEKYTGGLFGQGLEQNIREAYRFLIFNYEVGDEIYAFGFSRGAFSARVFLGLIRRVGILSRKHAARIDEALQHYRERLSAKDPKGEKVLAFRAAYARNICVDEHEEKWRCERLKDYVPGSSPVLKIKYLGVWDTVAAMGVPAMLPLSKWFNREYDFLDPALTDMVEFARHAVALDERRKLFPITLWDNVDELNAARGSSSDKLDAPYQQKWFPGTHGGVGGGGDIRGHSDAALAWIVQGAKAAGLEMDIGPDSRMGGISPDWRVPVDNMSNPKKSPMNAFVEDRVGPRFLWETSPSARRRWRAAASDLGGTQYRPGSLASIAVSLAEEAATSPDLVNIEGLEFETYTIVAGDTLSKLALKRYGKAELYPHIFAANRDTLDDPGEIFVGQVIRIPPAPPSPENG